VVVHLFLLTVAWRVRRGPHTTAAGRGTELPLPHAAQRDSIANCEQTGQARTRAGRMVKVYLSQDTNNYIEKQPECGSLRDFWTEYMLTWLSNCEWNAFSI